MDESYLGSILQFGFNYPIRGWVACHGQYMLINENQALFSLLGTTFGGDGRVSFVLPDLRKRKADGNYYSQGEHLPDGTPYIESYICIEGIYPPRN
jgi:microcystin-dependent protein